MSCFWHLNYTNNSHSRILCHAKLIFHLFLIFHTRSLFDAFVTDDHRGRRFIFLVNATRVKCLLTTSSLINDLRWPNDPSAGCIHDPHSQNQSINRAPSRASHRKGGHYAKESHVQSALSNKNQDNIFEMKEKRTRAIHSIRSRERGWFSRWWFGVPEEDDDDDDDHQADASKATPIERMRPSRRLGQAISYLDKLSRVNREPV